MGASPETGSCGDDRDESGVIVAAILDSLLQHRQSVTLRRSATRDCAVRRITSLGDVTRGTTGIERLAGLNPGVGFEEAATLRERDGVAGDSDQALKRGAFGSEK